MTKSELKNEIKRLVDLKVSQTRNRTEFKLETRPRIAEILARGAHTVRYGTPEHKEWSERQSKLWEFDSYRSDTKCLIRARLLAYAYVRGREYAKTEPKTASGNEAGTIVYAISRAAGVDEDKVLDWIEGVRQECAA